MAINALPDDCLRLIFDELGIQEQIRIRTSICSRWFYVIGQMFVGNRSLKVFGSIGEVQQFKRRVFEHNIDDPKLLHNVVLISNEEDKFQVSKCTLLPTLFPNLRELAISKRDHYEHHIPFLLSHWALTLQNCSLFGIPKSEEEAAKIWSAILKMSSLKTLSLFGVFRHEISANFPILPKLKNFVLIHYLPDLVPVLSQLTSCTNLVLSWVYLNVTQLIRVKELNPILFTKLEFLALGFISSSNGNREKNFRQLFHFVCHNFTNLKTFDMLYSDHLPLADLIPDLSHLSNLTDLWLYIGRDQLETESFHPLPALKSVKTLSLEIFDLTVDQFFKNIPPIFPNLESITLRCPDFDANLKGILEQRLKNSFEHIQKFKLKFV